MSLLAPLGLLLGLLAIPLLGLYFLKIRRRRVTVPSLLLWEELVRAERLARPFDRFRRNILLWLQLLLLLLVTLAFARPAIFGTGSTGRSVVLVIDTSASMAATDVVYVRNLSEDLVQPIRPQSSFFADHSNLTRRRV